MTYTSSRLRELRAARGLTQTEFAEMLGISLRTYQRYEQSERRLPLRSLVMLSQQDVNIDWLVTGRGQMIHQRVTELEKIQAVSKYWEANFRLLELSVRQLNDLLVAKYGKDVEDLIAQVEFTRIEKPGTADPGSTPAGNVGNKRKDSPGDSGPAGD